MLPILTALAIAIVTLPGWFIIRPWLPRYLAFAVGPGVTITAVSIAIIIFPRLGIAWNRVSALALIALLGVASHAWAWLLAGFERRRIVRQRSRGRLKTPVARKILKHEATTYSRLDCVGIGAGVVTAFLPIWIAIGPTNRVAQAWDAMFHQSALETIARTGNASPLGALAPITNGAPIFYPSTAHALAVLLPGSNQTTYNAMSIGLLLTFIIGIGAITKTLAPQARYTTAVTVWLAGGIKAFTANATLVAVFGYIAGLAPIPGIVALALYILGRRHYRLLPLLTGLLLGVAIAHGSAAFVLLVIGLPLAVTGWVEICRRHLTGRGAMIAWASGGIALAALLAVAWIARGPLAKVFAYRRPPLSYLAGLSDFPLDISSVATSGWGLWGSIFVALLAGIGYWAWVSGRAQLPRNWGWALLISLLAAIALTYIALGPENALRQLTAPWYRQGARVAVMAWLIAVIGIVPAILWLERAWTTGTGLGPWLKRGWQRGPAWIVIVLLLALITPVTNIAGRYQAVAFEYDPTQVKWGTMATQDQIDLIRTHSETYFSAPLTVLADPMRGGPLWYSLAGLNTVYPQLSAQTPKEYTALLEELGRDTPDPRRVCAAATGIDLVYLVPDEAGAGTADGMKTGPLSEPLGRFPRQLLTHIASTPDGAFLGALNCEGQR